VPQSPTPRPGRHHHRSQDQNKGVGAVSASSAAEVSVAPHLSLIRSRILSLIPSSSPQHQSPRQFQPHSQPKSPSHPKQKYQSHRISVSPAAVVSASSAAASAATAVHAFSEGTIRHVSQLPRKTEGVPPGKQRVAHRYEPPGSSRLSLISSSIIV
jgi:hypothetical protein